MDQATFGEDARFLPYIEAGAFVPVNIGSDGAYQLALRGRTERGGLTGREREYVFVSSDSYLLVSHGTVCTGGIEEVDASSAGCNTVPLNSGKYCAVVHLIDWEAEPGSTTADGSPAGHALPDFVVEISEAREDARYRAGVTTFERS
ncbi:hypothetical protein AN219_25300 [Streptomyces nanshensis]|nr:hypothetical protein AN219_25300 [Streptomyces nanshensis]